jgi:hypothetical protein
VHANHFISSYSTVDFNFATTGGGIVAPGSFLLGNSTISYNTAHVLGGVATFTADPADVYNSTITQNRATQKDSVGGISGTALHLESTIAANNYSANARADVGAVSGISGANNLILSSNFTVPPDTLSVDPMLGPLRDNGGPTPTHALSWGSPAIDHGNNAFNFDEDQVLSPRVRGGAADIGAVEFDGVFHNGFD